MHVIVISRYIRTTVESINTAECRIDGYEQSMQSNETLEGRDRTIGDMQGDHPG